MVPHKVSERQDESRQESDEPKGHTDLAELLGILLENLDS